MKVSEPMAAAEPVMKRFWGNWSSITVPYDVPELTKPPLECWFQGSELLDSTGPEEEQWYFGLIDVPVVDWRNDEIHDAWDLVGQHFECLGGGHMHPMPADWRPDPKYFPPHVAGALELTRMRPKQENKSCAD